MCDLTELSYHKKSFTSRWLGSRVWRDTIHKVPQKIGIRFKGHFLIPLTITEALSDYSALIGKDVNSNFLKDLFNVYEWKFNNTHEYCILYQKDKFVQIISYFTDPKFEETGRKCRKLFDIVGSKLNWQVWRGYVQIWQQLRHGKTNKLNK